MLRNHGRSGALWRDAGSLLALGWSLLLLTYCGSAAPSANGSADGAGSAPPRAAAVAADQAATHEAIDVCALIPQPDAEALLGAPITPPSGSPASGATAGACSWAASGTTPRSVALQLWTTDSLKRDDLSKTSDAAAYYAQTAPLVGSLWDLPAEPVAGVGDQAVWAAKESGGVMGVQGQLLVLSNDAVFQLTSLGVERTVVEAMAKHAIANY
jgi:hypothetical protein